MKRSYPAFLLVLSLIFASNALAQHQSFIVDPQASHVAFTLSDSFAAWAAYISSGSEITGPITLPDFR
jgi:hypothetical protein